MRRRPLMQSKGHLANCPFGGEKNSGLGRYNGQWSIEELTTMNWISVQHEPLTYRF